MCSFPQCTFARKYNTYHEAQSSGQSSAHSSVVCGKISFSQVPVYHSVQGRVPMWNVTHDTFGHGYHPPDTRYGNLPHPTASDIWWPSLETCSNLFIWGPPPPVLTSSGGHWNMYGRQVGDMHPTGMQSYINYRSIIHNAFLQNTVDWQTNTRRKDCPVICW